MPYPSPISRYTALYGGNFDPPHVGHALVVEALLNNAEVGEIWIVPAADSRYDKAPVAAFSARVAMVKSLIAEHFSGNTRVKVVDIQGSEDALASSYAIDTVLRLKLTHPALQFAWVVGADNVDGISKWKNSERLLQEVPFLVVGRPGYYWQDNLSKLPGKFIAVASLSESSAASSVIRAKIKAGESIIYLVTPGVSSYIALSKLYLEN